MQKHFQFGKNNVMTHRDVHRWSLYKSIMVTSISVQVLMISWVITSSILWVTHFLYGQPVTLSEKDNDNKSLMNEIKSRSMLHHFLLADSVCVVFTVYTQWFRRYLLNEKYFVYKWNVWLFALRCSLRCCISYAI